MHAPGLLAATTAALLTPLVAADWYMYAEFITSSVPEIGAETEYHFYAGPPSCDDVLNSPIFTPSSGNDVSGTKYGIRCDGCDAYNTNTDIKELEINLENWGHVTYYKDRNGDMVDLDGNVVGNCVQDTSDTIECTDGTLSAYGGFSQIFCTTSMPMPSTDNQ